MIPPPLGTTQSSTNHEMVRFNGRKARGLILKLPRAEYCHEEVCSGTCFFIDRISLSKKYYHALQTLRGGTLMPLGAAHPVPPQFESIIPKTKNPYFMRLRGVEDAEDTHTTHTHTHTHTRTLTHTHTHTHPHTINYTHTHTHTHARTPLFLRGSCARTNSDKPLYLPRRISSQGNCGASVVLD